MSSFSLSLLSLMAADKLAFKSMAKVLVPGLCKNDQFLGFIAGISDIDLHQNTEVAVSRSRRPAPHAAAFDDCHADVGY
jgi:hypothetical protein